MSRYSQVQSPACASGLSIFPKCFPQMAESATAPSILQCDPEVAGRWETALGGEHVPPPPGLGGGKKSPVPPSSAAPGTPHLSPRCPLLSSLALGGASMPPAADTRSSKTPEFSWGVAWPIGTVHGGCHFTRSSGWVMGQGPIAAPFLPSLALHGQQIFTSCTYSGTNLQGDPQGASRPSFRPPTLALGLSPCMCEHGPAQRAGGARVSRTPESPV